CCIVFAASVRSPRVPTRSFTLIPVPSTVGVPCSFWTLACLAASSTLHSLFGIPVRQASALPRASFRPTPHGGALASGCILPTAGRIRDFHPLERAPAGRTKKPGRISSARDSAVRYSFFAGFRYLRISSAVKAVNSSKIRILRIPLLRIVSHTNWYIPSPSGPF
ncbi:hypothetical protein SAMN04487771_102036, partial [[Clostridium] aminophilum]